jgi:hypothetical protein
MHDGRDFDIAPLSVTKRFPRHQPNLELSTVPVKDFGETIRGPLGWLVHARSGDKGSNANVGFWVRHQDEYDWMRTLLSTENLKGMLAREYNGKNIVSTSSFLARRNCPSLIETGSIRIAKFVGCKLSASSTS